MPGSELMPGLGLRQKHSLFLGILSAGPLTATLPPQRRLYVRMQLTERRDAKRVPLNNMVCHPSSSLAGNSFIPGQFNDKPIHFLYA